MVTVVGLSSDMKSSRSSTRRRFGGGVFDSDVVTGCDGLVDSVLSISNCLGVDRCCSVLHHFSLKRGSSTEAITYTSRSSREPNLLSSDFRSSFTSLLLNLEAISLNSFLNPRIQGITRLAATHFSPGPYLLPPGMVSKSLVGSFVHIWLAALCQAYPVFFF